MGTWARHVGGAFVSDGSHCSLCFRATLQQRGLSLSLRHKPQVRGCFSLAPPHNPTQNDYSDQSSYSEATSGFFVDGRVGLPSLADGQAQGAAASGEASGAADGAASGAASRAAGGAAGGAAGAVG